MPKQKKSAKIKGEKPTESKAEDTEPKKRKRDWGTDEEQADPATYRVQPETTYHKIGMRVAKPAKKEKAEE